MSSDNNSFPIELCTRGKELKKYNKRLFDYVKNSLPSVKPSSRIIIILHSNNLMIYCINKEVEKVITTYVDNYKSTMSVRHEINMYNSNKEYDKLIGELKAAKL